MNTQKTAVVTYKVITNGEAERTLRTQKIVLAFLHHKDAKGSFQVSITPHFDVLGLVAAGSTIAADFTYEGTTTTLVLKASKTQIGRLSFSANIEALRLSASVERWGAMLTLRASITLVDSSTSAEMRALVDNLTAPYKADASLVSDIVGTIAKGKKASSAVARLLRATRSVERAGRVADYLRTGVSDLTTPDEVADAIEAISDDTAK